jgi:hypothetical protein
MGTVIANSKIVIASQRVARMRARRQAPRSNPSRREKEDGSLRRLSLFAMTHWKTTAGIAADGYLH